MQQVECLRDVIGAPALDNEDFRVATVTDPAFELSHGGFVVTAG
jgi:hypothetical protein